MKSPLNHHPTFVEMRDWINSQAEVDIFGRALPAEGDNCRISRICITTDIESLLIPLYIYNMYIYIICIYII